jgi:hypothetical protein
MSRDPGSQPGSELDELFGEGVGAVRPRSGLVFALVAVGMALAVVGMACTPALGGIFVLLGLMVADKETARVESGYLPMAERPTVRRIRALAVAAVVAVVAMFAVQLVMLSFGLYNEPWLAVVEQLSTWRQEAYPPPPDAPDPAQPGPHAAPHGGAPGAPPPVAPGP